MSVAAMATGKALRRRVTWLDAALFVAFVGLGLGSWIAVNGIFQELPVVALTAPPQFNISVIESYAALLVAGANAYVFFVASCKECGATDSLSSSQELLVGKISICVNGLVCDRLSGGLGILFSTSSCSHGSPVSVEILCESNALTGGPS